MRSQNEKFKPTLTGQKQNQILVPWEKGVGGGGHKDISLNTTL